MITREQALQLIEEHVANKNIIKHMVALEAVMRALFERIANREKLIDETKEEWQLAGLLHDGDYCESVPVEKQGIQITEWVREKYDPPSSSGDFGEASIPDNVAHAMAAHNWNHTGVEPKSKMDWAIFCADSLTGLIVACALILPSKKLADVTPEFVLKKFKSSSFAAGTRREDIKLCEEKLGLPLRDFIAICLKSMQNISAELGL